MKENLNTENNEKIEEGNEKTLPQLAAEEGKGYFREGLNCAECVMVSYRNNYNKDLPMEAIALSTAFGGGFASRKNHTCGAITAAVMAVSSSFGRRDPFAKDNPKDRIVELREIYGLVSPMVEEIEEAFGTVICKELSDPYGDFGGKERKRNCMRMVEFCSEIAVKHALRIEEELKKKESNI